jgi:hypothetical protein
LEVFGAAIIAFVQMTAEFLNTPGTYTTSAMNADDNRKKLHKNYRHATVVSTFVILWLVLICYHFDVFTFSNVAYMGGLFAGINPKQVGGILPDTVRDITNLANLNNVGLYPNSVFIGRTAAWALYFFGCILGGIIGGFLFKILFWFGAMGPAVGAYRTTMFPNMFMRNKSANSQVNVSVDEDVDISYQRMPPPQQSTAAEQKGRLPTGLFPTK